MEVKAQPQPQPLKPKYVFGKSYNFRLRQHSEGNFRGLWQLALIDDKGRVLKELSDADALNFCIENMMGELENDGY